MASMLGFTNGDLDDVQPLYVDDGGKVAAIQYSHVHVQTLAYFRALIARNERSARMLRMTELMIMRNQADYTAWQVRWECILALGEEADLAYEFDFTHGIMRDNAKNYQLWNHRRKCALKQGVSHAQDELAFADEAIRQDEKNYHAWAHRQAIVKEYGLWDSELAYSAALIHRDHRNNSAWTQRAWIIDNAPKFCGAPSAEILLHRELLYAAELIKNFKEQNESLWTYIRGLFGLRHWARQRLLLSRTPAVFELCIEVLKGCPHAVWPRDLLSECYLGLMQLALERLAARLNPLGAAYAAAAPATPVAVPPVDGGQNAASAAAAAVAGSSRNRAAAGGAEASEQDMEIEDSAASEALQLLAGSPPPKAAPAYQSNLLPFTPAGPGQALAGSHPPQSTAFPDTPFTPIALPEECDDDKDAFEDAYTILEALLQDLMEVDPARCMYYHHRVSEMEALRACMQL